MKRRTRPSPTTSASRTSTSGSTSARRASISAWILLMSPPLSTKKRALRPLPKVAVRPRKACASRLAALTPLRSFSSAVAVDPVVVPFRVHRRGQRERLARLGGPPQLQQRAPPAEERVVVRRRPLPPRLELGARLLEVAGAEIGAPERLANRRLVGL